MRGINMRWMKTGFLLPALLSSGCLTVQNHNAFVDASNFAPLAVGAGGGPSVLLYLAIFLSGMVVSAGLLWVGWQWRRRRTENEVGPMESPQAKVIVGVNSATKDEPDAQSEQPKDAGFSTALR